MKQSRCRWPGSDPLMIAYHDNEWGTPLHDDRKLFEFMVLDCFQAGLSWKTVLYKRENFRKAFDDFDFRRIAGYDPEKTASLLADAGIIRNKMKIAATITNAVKFCEVIREFDSFDAYIWRFTNGKTINNQWETDANIPPRSPESDAMSKDLVARGFKFSGSTICYAFMQAAGMINDHTTDCFRHREVSSSRKLSK